MGQMKNEDYCIALITVNCKFDRLSVCVSCPSEKDELSVTNNYLSPASCKWQSSQGSSIRLELLTLHDSARVPVPLANSQDSLDHFS